mgnify:FL=1
MIEFEMNGSEVKINNGFDPFCNVNIRVHTNLGVLLDFEDFYGEFSVTDIEQIIAKMKELQGENNG